MTLSSDSGDYCIFGAADRRINLGNEKVDINTNIEGRLLFLGIQLT